MREPRDPEYPAEDIYGIVSREYRFPYDVREVIARIVDGSEFHEFKKLYGSTAASRCCSCRTSRASW
jgi:3-methylcrotonyl-CoA carboxylase beta subunit